MSSVHHHPLRLVFYGTSDFAVPTLEGLVSDQRFEVMAVVTQPDRPAGRQNKPQPTPIKIDAQRLHLPVNDLRSTSDLTSDLAVVASFGQILPQEVLDRYPLGVINIHPSLLPKYRGPTPFVDPILHGDQETGISIMKMDALMDHGPLLKQVTEPIHSTDTGKTLGDRLWQQAAELLPEVLVAYASGRIVLHQQDHTQATKTRLLTREDAHIDWTQRAEHIERKIRAYTPWPGTYTIHQGMRLKIHQAMIGPACHLPPGSTFIHQGMPAMCCGANTSLLLIELQPEGKKRMDGQAFLHGCRIWEHRRDERK